MHIRTEKHVIEYTELLSILEYTVNFHGFTVPY